jgi:hypothetical protein
MASQQAFAARDRGDTTAKGLLRSGAMSADSAMDMTLSGQFTIPYEFPKPGRYKIWVQVKPNKQVLTAAFVADVH